VREAGPILPLSFLLKKVSQKRGNYCKAIAGQYRQRMEDVEKRLITRQIWLILQNAYSIPSEVV
jgi:hypothetical protein